MENILNETKKELESVDKQLAELNDKRSKLTHILETLGSPVPSPPNFPYYPPSYWWWQPANYYIITNPIILQPITNPYPQTITYPFAYTITSETVGGMNHTVVTGNTGSNPTENNT